MMMTNMILMMTNNHVDDEIFVKKIISMMTMTITELDGRSCLTHRSVETSMSAQGFDSDQ